MEKLPASPLEPDNGRDSSRTLFVFILTRFASNRLAFHKQRLWTMIDRLHQMDQKPSGLVHWLAGAVGIENRSATETDLV